MLRCCLSSSVRAKKFAVRAWVPSSLLNTLLQPALSAVTVASSSKNVCVNNVKGLEGDTRRYCCMQDAVSVSTCSMSENSEMNSCAMRRPSDSKSDRSCRRDSTVFCNGCTAATTRHAATTARKITPRSLRAHGQCTYLVCVEC